MGGLRYYVAARVRVLVIVILGRVQHVTKTPGCNNTRHERSECRVLLQKGVFWGVARDPKFHNYKHEDVCHYVCIASSA